VLLLRKVVRLMLLSALICKRRIVLWRLAILEYVVPQRYDNMRRKSLDRDDEDLVQSS